SRTVIVGSMDGTAQLWDVASGKKFGPPLQVGGQYPSFAFSRDGKTVLTSAHDIREVRLWDATTGARLDFPVRLPPQVRILVATIQPEGKIVLLGTEDNAKHIARFWDAATGQPIGPPLTHDERIRGARFSPDDRIIHIPSDGDTARFWDV